MGFSKILIKSRPKFLRIVTSNTLSHSLLLYVNLRMETFSYGLKLFLLKYVDEWKIGFIWGKSNLFQNNYVLCFGMRCALDVRTAPWMCTLHLGCARCTLDVRTVLWVCALCFGCASCAYMNFTSITGLMLLKIAADSYSLSSI